MMTKKENGYCYTGEWDSDYFPDLISADDEDEALYVATDWMLHNGDDPDEFIFKVRLVSE